MKKRIEEILAPIFGESIKEMLENFYSDTNQSEILELAEHMLKGYFGDKKAQEIMMELKDISNKQKSDAIWC